MRETTFLKLANEVQQLLVKLFAQNLQPPILQMQKLNWKKIVLILKFFLYSNVYFFETIGYFCSLSASWPSGTARK